MTAHVPSPEHVAMHRKVSCEQPSTIKNCGSDVCVYDQCHHDLNEQASLVAAAATLVPQALPPTASAADFAKATTALMALKKQKRRAQQPALSTLPPKKRGRRDAPCDKAGVDRSRAALVRRAAAFTALLKETHPPGSPVFELYKCYVTAQGAPSSQDHKHTVLALINLLKPTPVLLKMFITMMPKWCFATTKSTRSTRPVL